MTAFQMLDELAAVTAERDRARNLAAKLEARLELAERVVEAGRRVAIRGQTCPVCLLGSDFCDEQLIRCDGTTLREALAAYDEASR